MRITSWNFLHGQRINPAENKALSEVITEFDSEVIALQEVDWRQARSSGTVQPAEFCGAMLARDKAQGQSQNLEWGFAPTLVGTPGVKWRKLKLDEERVITVDNGESDLYGLAIISKVPVKKWLRKELGKAWIGLPLLIANEKGKVAPLYVRDEPRVALAAVLENGWTVINVHLSFVPFVNIYQLLKVTSWVKKLEKEYATKVMLVGDFNLPWGIPVKLTRWMRGTQSNSYPSWKPSISFDYILLRESEIATAKEIEIGPVPISDHRPISVRVS
jgi:endonuclease/exonuclease/phosphatase family metal-dependent hydrolase